MSATATTVQEVTELIVEVLGLDARATAMDASTALLGSMPELDSMAVVGLVAGLEEKFGIAVDDADITAETFETVGTLADFVEEQRGR